MDPIAQLALMTKAKRVFESPGTFLSFPALAPLNYSVAQLKFLTDGDMTAQDLAESVEFSRVTNVMPRGIVAPTTSDELLWEVLEEVLSTGEYASGTMSADEQAQYDAALAYLYVPSLSDGLPRADSPALSAYKQCRDAVFKAQEDYKTQQITAGATNDPTVKAQWAVDEPRLRGVIADLESDWSTTGCRQQVEAARQIEASAGERSPARLWNEWQNAFTPEVDLITDTNGIAAPATGIAPFDVFDGVGWPSFTLTGVEMTALVSQAPPELTAVFGSPQGISDIESVSFEYRTVGLVRPWFRPVMLRSGIWRLGPHGGELSDGTEPPTGRCPSYVAALLMARNIVVTRHAQPAKAVTRGGLLQNIAWPPFAARKPVTHARVRQHRTPPAGTVRDHRDAAKRTRQTLRGQTFRQAAPHAPTLVRPPAAEDASTNDITVLAFICVRTPRSPNPDQSLAWR